MSKNRLVIAIPLNLRKKQKTDWNSKLQSVFLIYQTNYFNSTEVTTSLSEVFKNALNKDKLTVKVEKLKNDGIAAVITLSEEGRRMQDMMKMYAMNGMGGMDMSMFAADQTLTLNANNALVQYIMDNKDSEHVPMFAEQLYDLALLSNQPLSTEAMAKFVKRSNDIMLLLTK